MFGNFEHSCAGGRRMHRGEGFGMRNWFGHFSEAEDFPNSKEMEIEFLKRKKYHIELRKHDVDLELKYIDEKIKSFEK